MVFTIGDLSFKEVSGPTSITVLFPKFEIFNRINNFIPPIILLGDEHSNRKSICTPSLDVLSTFSPFWMRLIDSIGTKKFPVQYFIEANFPTNLLSSSYYLHEDLKHWNYEVSNDNIMSYIPIYHPECFDENNVSCITKFTNYQYADLRLGYSVSKISLHDSHKIKRHVLKFVKNIYPLSLQKTKRSYDRKELIYKETTQDYESIVYDTIENALSQHRSFDYKNVAYINGYSILDILQLIYDDPTKLSRIIFNKKSKLVQTNSKLYNIIKSLDIDFCIDLFQKYLVYIISVDKDIRLAKDKILSGIQKYKYHTSLLNNYGSYGTKIKIKNTDYNLLYKIEKYEKAINNIMLYNKCCKNIATTIMMPFNDLFVLFKSWTSCQISIYNAGNDHCLYLREFLKNYYEPIICENSSQNLYKTKYNENANVVRCISFKDIDLNIDHLLIENLFNQMDKVPQEYNTEMKSKFKLNSERINILGRELYIEMLKGIIISPEILKEKCKDINDCTNKLDFSTITINTANEYIDKLKF